MLRGMVANQGGPVRLFQKTAANMQLTTDQAFTKLGTFSRYIVTEVVAVHASGATTVACAGGIYDAASKGGNVIVANTQSWINLTAAGKIVKATLPALLGTDSLTATPFLSLTTGSTGAATADLTIMGYAV